MKQKEALSGQGGRGGRGACRVGPSFPATCVLADRSPSTGDFRFSRGIKGLDSTQRYVPSSAPVMAAAEAQRPGYPPSSPWPSLRMRAHDPLGFTPRGRTQVGHPGQSAGRPRSRLRPLSIALGSGLHVSLFGYVRPLQGWENRAVENWAVGTLLGWGAAGRGHRPPSPREL